MFCHACGDNFGFSVFYSYNKKNYMIVHIPFDVGHGSFLCHPSKVGNTQWKVEIRNTLYLA